MERVGRGGGDWEVGWVGEMGELWEGEIARVWGVVQGVVWGEAQPQAQGVVNLQELAGDLREEGWRGAGWGVGGQVLGLEVRAG